MSKPVARYAISHGLAGCYLPDNQSGPIIVHTRRDLANAIRSELEAYEMPASLFRQVRLLQLWRHIVRHGSSVAHFSLEHGGYSLTFHGLTEEEATAMEGE